MVLSMVPTANPTECNHPTARLLSSSSHRVPRFRLLFLQDDDAAVKAEGAKIGAQMCRDIMAAGGKGLHFYTLNMEEVTFAILDQLGLKKQ